MLFLLYYGIYAFLLLLTVVAAIVIWRILRSRMPYQSWLKPVALVAAVLLSCLLPALDHIAFWRDQQRLAEVEIRPDRLDLPPGALLHVEESNHAGVTCGYPCDFASLPFVTTTTTTNPSGYTETADILDLRDAISTSDQVEPYRYAFISIAAYHYESLIGISWSESTLPEDVKGAHLLVELPANGLLDLKKARILYLRFNLQRDVSQYFFWGLIPRTENSPAVEDIFADLSRISH